MWSKDYVSWNAISEQSIVCPGQDLSGAATGKAAARRWLPGHADLLLKHIHGAGLEAGAIAALKKVVSSLPSSALYSFVPISVDAHW